MFWLNLGEDGRVLSAAISEFVPDGMTKIDALPEGDVSNYRLVGGEYVYDPLPLPDEGEEIPTLESRIKTLETTQTNILDAIGMILQKLAERGL